MRVLNDIKSNIHSLPLTPSQIACRDRIEERLAYPGVVNLYGLPGVGKTVLGWAMAADARARYLVHLSRLKGRPFSDDEDPVVFIDNASAERTAFRRLLGALESAEVERAIAVTRRPADDYVFRAELCLMAEDVEIARRNLASLGHTVSGDDWGNLWHGLLRAARERR